MLTRFARFLGGNNKHEVGRAYHAEYWIHTEELEAFNRLIIGTIDVVCSFER